MAAASPVVNAILGAPVTPAASPVVNAILGAPVTPAASPVVNAILGPLIPALTSGVRLKTRFFPRNRRFDLPGPIST